MNRKALKQDNQTAGAAILNEIENIALLVKQFSEASARWPNLAHHMIRWPIGSPQPDLTAPTNLGNMHTRPWTAVTRKEGILQFHAIAGGWFSEYIIPPNPDVSDSCFTLLTGRRWFGKGGRRDDRELSGDDMDAVDRFQTLSTQASNLYSRMSSDSSTRIAWIENLHELSTLPWVDLPGYSPGYTLHSIPDVFLESANVLVRLSQSKVDVRANTSVVFVGIEPTTDVKDLCFLLKDAGETPWIEIARKFKRGNDGKAKSLLAQIRRLRSNGRVIFSTK